MDVRLGLTTSETGFIYPGPESDPYLLYENRFIKDHDCLSSQALINKQIEEITDISFYPCDQFHDQ